MNVASLVVREDERVGRDARGPRQRGDGVVAPRPRGRWATKLGRPAALEWRDAHMPLVGHPHAAAWLPTILLAGSLVALVYLLQTSSLASTGYDIQRLQAERSTWLLRNEQLRLELAKRQSLTWVEAEATGRLGMVRPHPSTLTYVKAAR